MKRRTSSDEEEQAQDIPPSPPPTSTFFSLWKRVIAAFQTPTFPEDEDKTRNAQILSRLLLNMLIFTGVSLVATVVVFVQKKLTVSVLGLIVASIFVSHLLLRRGMVRAAGSVFVWSLWAVFTLAFISTGRMGNTFPVLHIAMVVVAGLLLGNRAALVLFLGSGSVGLVLVLLEKTGMPLYRYFPAPPMTNWVIWMLAFVLTLTPLRILVKSTAQSLMRARNSERRYISLFDEAPMMYLALFDVDGTPIISNCNNLFLERLGYEREQVIGHSLSEFCAPDSCGAAAAKGGIQDVFRDQTGYLAERDLVSKDGRIIHTLFRTTPEMDQSGKVVGALVAFLDETESRRAAAALQESEIRLRNLSDNLPGGMVYQLDTGVDNEMRRFTFVSAGIKDLHHLSQDDVLADARLLYNQLVEEDRQLTAEREAEAIRKMEPFSLDVRFNLTPDQVRWSRLISAPRRLPNGHLIWDGIEIDITEQKNAVEALLKSEEKFRFIAEHTADVIWVMDMAQQRFTYVSPSIEKLRGFTPEEILAQSMEESLTPDSLKRVSDSMAENIHRFFEGGGVPFTTVHELDQPRKDGSIIHTEVNATFVLNKQGALETVGVSRDITERKKAELERMRLVSVIEQSHDNIFITDVDGNIEYTNRAFQESTGYTLAESIHKNPRFLKSGQHPVGFYKEIWETITKGEVWRGNIVNRKKDGALLHESAVIFPIFDIKREISCFAAVKRDISEQLLLEEQLRQTQKMEAIGTLAGGIAHDFNNILSGIISYAELLEMDLSELPECRSVHGYALKILKAGERAAELVKQILTFSRKADYELQPLDLVPLVKETMKFLVASLPPMIEIVPRMDTKPMIVRGDCTQIHQIVLNLSTNAFHAMEKTGGKLEISLSNLTITHRSPDTCNLNTGDYVVLTVADSGMGIDEETKLHIFDPFFTTKERGKGTGLGLSVVHGIVEKMGGAIAVESKPGQGAKFDVFFPASNTEVPADPLSCDVPLPSGSESILLVDDEIEIVEIYADLLKRQGYTVEGMTDPLSALQRVRSAEGRLDLVISDYIMPKLDGIELSRKIREHDAALPVILISGLEESLDRDELKLVGIQESISKPIENRILAETVRRVLDRQ